MKTTVLVLLSCLIIGGGYAVHHVSLTRAKARVALLEKDLSTVTAEAERWRATATTLQGRVDAQGKLADACLAREAAAQTDAALRESILTLRPPVVIAPEEQQRGVSRETRRATADYLNRPL